MLDTHNGKIAIVLFFVVGAAIVATTSLSLGQTTPLYLDPTAPIPDRVEDLLSRMTLDEKIGQMTLIDWPNLSSDSHVATYHLGALLSTSGRLSTEQNTPTTWADMYDNYQSIALSDRLGIPILFGTDAVHGHNNLHGSTIFPHNIGLGATRDTQLIEAVGRITAIETAATGFRWTFSPCLCVARNERWGRTYESFGEDPEITSLMTAIVTGYQGTSLSDPDSILATGKHWVGDGGTIGGVDQGDTQLSEAELRATHVPPYIDAISKGVGSIMISFSSWSGELLHGHEYLITDVLKGELGFSGIVLSDFRGINQLPGDYASDVRTSVTAGIDMVMVPDDYQLFTDTLRNEVNGGKVPLTRIDDAVRRILTKKFELGLFEAPYADRTDQSLIGSAAHRAVAQEAVRKSLVLLKNENDILPLAKNVSKVFVAGKNADDIGNQSGGWTITWQGRSGDTTPGTTILEGIRNTVDPSTIVTYEQSGVGAKGHDVAIVVIGETPYAEGDGDKPSYLGLDQEDFRVLDRVKRAGIPTIVVLVSGRPLIVTDELPDWDAFVAAWLPGTEGQGVADVLFGDYNLSGTLPISWPRLEGQIPINVGDTTYDPLFPYGFGLTFPVFGAPTADAGSDQTVSDGNSDGVSLVTLDGSASSDSSGTIVSHEWKEGSIILGNGPMLSQDFSVVDSPHTVTLTVLDNDGLTDSDDVIIIVHPNQLPSADAGGDQTVFDGDRDGFESVFLDGTNSTDGDGIIVSYEWRKDGVPFATSATASASFEVGTHTVTLAVEDDGAGVDTDTVVITVSDQPAQTCGDLNSDSAVDVFDAIITLQIVVGLIELTPALQIVGDLNHDGAINVFDAIMILQHIVGSIEITGCGPP